MDALAKQIETDPASKIYIFINITQDIMRFSSTNDINAETEASVANEFSIIADEDIDSDSVAIEGELDKDIPIEEINRDKRGFRIKALRDYGYNSIADISTASVYTIASVHGISEDTAYSIKKVVDDIV